MVLIFLLFSLQEVTSTLLVHNLDIKLGLIFKSAMSKFSFLIFIRGCFY